MVALKKTRSCPNASCEGDFIWKKSLCQCDCSRSQDVESFWITFVSPKPKDKRPEKRQREDTGTEEKALWRRGQRVE